MKIQLKRSNVLSSGAAKTPTASQLEYGELAVNYNNTDPAIFLKDSNNNVIRISGVGNISDDGLTNVPDGTSPPSNPEVGNLWYNSDQGRLYIYFQDADTSQWVDASPDSWDPSSYPDVTNASAQSNTLDDRYAMVNGGNSFTGNLTIPDKIIHSADTNTAIRFPANDTFSVETAGNERLRIDSSGRLLVGTTTEGQVNADTLTVAENGHCGITIRSSNTTTGNLFFSDGTSGTAEYTGAIVYDHSSDSLEFYSGDGSEKMRIDSSGRLLVGTTTANGNMTVNMGTDKNISFTGGISEVGSVPALQATNTSGSSLASMGFRGTDLRFATGSAERMRITSSGRVGIGTTSPGQLLHVDAGSGGSHAEVTVRTTGYSGNQVNLIAQLSPEVMGYVESSERALGFKANGAERMRIDSSGKVLINTTTASSYADRLLTVGNTSHTSPTIEIRSATNGFPGLVFSDSTVADVNSYRGAIEYSHSSNHMQIRTNSDVRMLIDSSGRVGIGATSFNDTRERLRIQSPSGSDTFVTIKAPSNSGESALFFGDSDFNRGAVSYEHSGDNMLFRVNDAERMRVDSSGRLIIGTGGDVSGGDTDVKLQVASGSGPSIQLCRTDSSTTANELLGRIFASTEDGGTSQVCGQITFRAEGSHTINDHATRIEFATTKDGANGVTERMRISEDGSLHHNSNSHGIATYLTASAGTAKYAFRGHNNTSSGIYGGTISFTVWSNGNVENTNDSYGGISDVKLKENIVDAGSQWDDFKAVKFRKYNFKEETGLETHTQLGVIAQELELTSPGLVYETADKDEDGNDLGTTTKAVKSSILTKKALVALQEAMARIEQLETKVAALEAG